MSSIDMWRAVEGGAVTICGSFGGVISAAREGNWKNSYGGVVCGYETVCLDCKVGRREEVEVRICAVWGEDLEERFVLGRDVVEYEGLFECRREVEDVEVRREEGPSEYPES
jgi:hypothetical protein